MKILVTGVAGFAGVHLARYLVGRGNALAGICLPGMGRQTALPSEVKTYEADIIDPEAVATVLNDWKPEAIFHLAAFSNPESSGSAAKQALEVNIIGGHNLLQAALETGLRPRVLLVGSCQQYGAVADSEQPIREDQPQRPLTPYGVSKTAQEHVGLRFFLAEELPVFLVRPFNHTGPGQEASYVCSSFARQVVEIESGRREPLIRVGNLSARRDFSDVRDVVPAYFQILERGKPGDPYNLCRGQAFSIQEILDTLLELTDAKVSVEVDEARYHAVDVPLLLGDNTKLRRELGWEPHYSLRETLADLLDDWRARDS
jgi:GDP-4-dehydro-6-deoxy-D-mannose reductase